MPDILNKPKLLLVDDDWSIALTLGCYLERGGYVVSIAQSQAEALEMYEKEQPAAVITDLDLNGDDGLELLKALRARDKKLPVVVLTGMGYDPDLFEEAAELGASSYFSKTDFPELILVELEKILGR